MEHETKVALVPRVIVGGAMGPKEYGVLLTNQRTIFVLETASKAGIGAALGGAIGAAIAQAATTRRYVDYESANPDALASDSKNIVVPHTALARIALRRKFGTYRLRLEYATPQGKRKKILAMVVPPTRAVKANKARGMGRKQTLAEYARTVQQAYQRALPPERAGGAEWSL